MSERERQLVVALWKQTDELLVRTRRQIEALGAEEDNGDALPQDSDGLRRDVLDGEDEPRPRF
jgi:hypothetical protein